MKYLKLPELAKEALLQEIAEQLNGKWTAKIQFTLPEPPLETEKPTVIIPKDVWERINAYVQTTAVEIGWHGCVERNGNTFTITKVFLYPQRVTAATVQTTTGAANEGFTEYEKWVDEELDVETYNTMRFHGHSHVNMAVSPSGTDTEGEERRVDSLYDDDYYIYMILNKCGKMRWAIYDKTVGILFENNTTDHDITIITGDQELKDSVEEEKKKYITYTTYQTTTYGGNYGGYSGGYKSSSPVVYKGGSESKKTPGWSGDEVSKTSTTFYLPPNQADAFIKKHSLSVFEEWKDIPDKGYVRVFTCTTKQTLSGKMRRRIVAAGGVFVDVSIKIEKPNTPMYPGAYSGVYDYDTDEGLNGSVTDAQENYLDQYPALRTTEGEAVTEGGDGITD